MIQKTQTAKESNDKVDELELIELAILSVQGRDRGNITKDNLENALKMKFNDNTITVK